MRNTFAIATLAAFVAAHQGNYYDASSHHHWYDPSAHVHSHDDIAADITTLRSNIGILQTNYNTILAACQNNYQTTYQTAISGLGYGTTSDRYLSSLSSQIL